MMAFLGMFWLFWVLCFALILVSLWKVYAKAGQPGWAGIIPIYNLFVMMKIIGRPWWWLLLCLIPLVNIIIGIIISIDVAKSFGQSIMFAIGLLLLPFIFYAILAFGGAKYMGPSAAGSSL